MDQVSIPWSYNIVTGGAVSSLKFMLQQDGPQFTVTPAVSFFVNCETQGEIDEMREKLSEGGYAAACWMWSRLRVA
jgi:predicted 3-demethylubiquinone-9 3-methyltransferase (glyoxalase superfamily)